MSNELTVSSEIISSLVLKGDMSGLSPNQKVQYVMNMCDRLGLDPLTQPFKILKLQGKEVLYADKGCAQQLCKIYKISTEVTKREKVEDIYIVTVRASGADGRFTDEDGAVTIGSSKGDTLANAMGVIAYATTFECICREELGKNKAKKLHSLYNKPVSITAPKINAVVNLVLNVCTSNAIKYIIEFLKVVLLFLHILLVHVVLCSQMLGMKYLVC